MMDDEEENVFIGDEEEDEDDEDPLAMGFHEEDSEFLEPESF